jgi:cytoskeletal protein CcmA (bactofilin family)
MKVASVEKQEIREQTFNFIGKNSHFKGHLTFEGQTRICGTIDGDVTILNDGQLIIEPTGKIKGKITGHHIEIYGEVEGEIQSSNKVIIKPASRVRGQINTETLTIMPGSTVEIEGNTH